MYKKKIAAILFLTGIVGSALVTAKDTINISRECRIKAKKSVIFKFNLEKIPKGKQVRIFLDARIDWGGLGGNRPAMQAFINGNKLMGKMLLNKPLTFSMRVGSRLNWSKKNNNSYRLMYSNDFSDKIKTLETYAYGIFERNQDPYKFVWDITPYIHVGINSFKIKATAIKIVVRNIGIETGKPMPRINDLKIVIKPAPTGAVKTYQPKANPEAVKTIQVSQKGNIEFNIEGKKFKLLSRTSYPNKGWSNNQVNASWEKLSRGESKILSWKGPGYKVSRKISLEKDHIKVADTITNTSKKLIGVIVENKLLLPEIPEKILLAGIVRSMKYCYNPANPTAMAQFKNLAVGLVAEDDIFRTHCKLFRTDKFIGIADPRLGIAPGKAHTLEWSIYMVFQGDYYDFINAIRRNWGSNYTMAGPYLFSGDKPYWKWTAKNLTMSYLRQWAKKSPAKLIITHLATNPNLPYASATVDNPAQGHGTAIPKFKVWCDKTRALVEKMKIVNPEVKVFAYLHKTICTEVGFRDKYRDSIAMTGKVQGKRYSKPPTGLFLPTLNNSYGKALAKVYEYIIDDLGANIYLDEIGVGIAGYGVYPEWDDCSVSINPSTHDLNYKLSSANLLMKPWIARLVKYLKSKNKTMLANGPAIHRTMLNWHIQTFVEDGQGVDGIIAMHLGTPLVFTGYKLGLPGYEYGKKGLNYGGIPFTRSGPWNNVMFPITPIELRQGVIIAKERIITNRSGRFGWGDASRAEVYIYDGKGKLTTAPSVKGIRSGDKVFTEIRMPSNHMAVLVRLKNATAGKIVSLSTNEKIIKLEMNSKNWGKQTQIKDEDTLCLKLKASKYLTAKPFFEANKDKTYAFSITAKSVGGKCPRMLFGVICYDADKKIIPTKAINSVANTATILAAKAEAGSNSVIIKNWKNWKAGGYVAFNTDNSGNFNDLPNRNLSSKITRITQKDNKFFITLQKPIKKSYPAGTNIRLHKAGNSYLYLVSSKIPDKWKTYKATVKGISETGLRSRSFKPSTKFFRILCFIIGKKDDDCFILIKDVQIETKGSKITKTKILKADFNKCQNK